MDKSAVKDKRDKIKESDESNGNRSNLEGIYFDANHPAGYSNASVLHRHSKGWTLKEIKDWLAKQRPYTLHRQARKKFPRNKIIVYSIDQQWEVDLADLPAITAQNDGYRYLFCCIDVLSKYAWVIPLKRKTGEALLDGFKKLFSSTERRPNTVRCDKGGEFNNAKVKSYLDEKGIRLFTSQNEVKAAIVERFQRTLKGYMWRYFTATNTERYIDKLQSFVNAYNHRIHRSIKRRPVDVTKKNQHEIFETLYPSLKTSAKKDRAKKDLKPRKYKFKVGDAVRISKYKKVFEKGYKENWTEEIFTVSKRLARSPPVYRIKDSRDEPIIGTFYEEELQKVERPEEYIIDEIIDTRGRGRRKEVLVSWKGYPKEVNSWIPASFVTNIKSRF